MLTDGGAADRVRPRPGAGANLKHSVWPQEIRAGRKSLAGLTLRPGEAPRGRCRAPPGEIQLQLAELEAASRSGHQVPRSVSVDVLSATMTEQAGSSTLQGVQGVTWMLQRVADACLSRAGKVPLPMKVRAEAAARS
jgi:hypothetical protein